MIGNHSPLSNFLADTWWFGLTQRLSEAAFSELVQLRAEQGFTAVQLVVGIPPEVGPENENAGNPAGFPWTVNGVFNDNYLAFARKRIQYLNKRGLLVIVYGAWGHQIDWLGQDGMITWWRKIIEALDDLNIIYCLSGESNLWVLGEASQLLPDKTTADFGANRLMELVGRLPPRLQSWAVTGGRGVKRPFQQRRLVQRRQKWSYVLAAVAQYTNRPVIIHTLPGEISDGVVTNSHLLAATTTQTGHSDDMRSPLWRLPLAGAKRGLGRPFINLEPWYEGIRGEFGPRDQLYAYWVSTLAGAASYCYGAHGVWNVGDGRFLAQWGRQTFAEAVALDTPRLLGLSHQQHLLRRFEQGQTFYGMKEGELTTIGRINGEKVIQFFPDAAQISNAPSGAIWLPLKGIFVETLPTTGQAVFFCN